MGDQLVHLLEPSCYRTFVAPISAKESGKEFVHVATLEEPGVGIYQAYVKMYRPEFLHKGLFNEIAGFLFASVLKLPQPEKAWVVKVPLSMLPTDRLPDWLKDYRNQGGEIFPAFSTSRVNGSCAALEITGAADFKRLVEDVRKWAHLPNAISLDNTITNVDRHLNNLLRVGKHSYSLIDNGRLVDEFGLWKPESLNVDHNYENKLCEYVWAKSPTADELSKASLGAREHYFGFAEVIDELKHWGGLLLDGAELAAFLQFLEERAKAAETILTARYTSAA